VATKIEQYVHQLRQLETWDDFLLRESGLPGPRGNLELAQAVARVGSAELFKRYRTYTLERAPENTPETFLAFCGVLGLGRLAAEGQRQALAELRLWASDPRWRIREAVAMALQHLGRVDMKALLDEMLLWKDGSALEKRAVAAALCEPELLQVEAHAAQVLAILDDITASVAATADRRSDAFKALRQGLAYCWSVAVVAALEPGKALMEAWLATPDRDIQWIMRQNLKKKRLARMDADWVARWQEQGS
jgi:hypothetical protein